MIPDDLLTGLARHFSQAKGTPTIEGKSSQHYKKGFISITKTKW